MSFQSDGFVFSASNYEAMNPGMQKQFLQTAASAITKEMLHEVLVQECTCTYVDPYRVRSVCFTKERKEAVSSLLYVMFRSYKHVVNVY